MERVEEIEGWRRRSAAERGFLSDGFAPDLWLSAARAVTVAPMFVDPVSPCWPLKPREHQSVLERFLGLNMKEAACQVRTERIR